MNIGHVQQKQFTAKDKSVTKYIELSLRSPGIAFSATLSKVKEKTQDNSPDYSLWFSPNRRGEHFDRIKIGSLWMKTSEKGNPYMSGYIESPIFPNGKIYISIVKYTPRGDMPVQDILYNCLWSPEKKENDYNQDYQAAYTPPPETSPKTTTTTTSTGVPVEIDIDESDIPF